MKKAEVCDYISYEDIKEGQVVKLDHDKNFYMMVTRKLRNKEPVYHFFKIDLKTGINTDTSKPYVTHVYNKYGELVKILKEKVEIDEE